MNRYRSKATGNIAIIDSKETTITTADGDTWTRDDSKPEVSKGKTVDGVKGVEVANHPTIKPMQIESKEPVKPALVKPLAGKNPNLDLPAGHKSPKDVVK